ncbi:hypothetical protein PsorP6_004410 [Peronosclerospora sorghi]|uniref:Uncharacterized protein n=1 Tax=Peronosclerospora sorghi TaxID=230839 RepID=A0ACC0VK78_9STRA|nr:hypothetical protein PsorP6_004410 [Peronosclerospora sorghi]
MPLRRTTISLVNLCGQYHLSLLGTLWLTALNSLTKRSWNWVLVRGSVGSAHTALTDGNEIVLELLTKNVEINAD